MKLSFTVTMFAPDESRDDVRRVVEKLQTAIQCRFDEECEDGLPKMAMLIGENKESHDAAR